MENKMYYKCAICGNAYEELKERISCETSCLKKQEVEAKKAAERKLKEERAARKAHVDEIVEKALEEIRKFNEDYGYYELNADDFRNIWPSRIFHHFI